MITINQITHYINQYQKQLIVGAGAFVFAGFAAYGYLEYAAYITRKAHQQYVELVRNAQAEVGDKKKFDFDQLSFETAQGKWQHVEGMAAKGYASYSSTSLAPLFLAQQAEAVLQQGDLKRALPLMEKAVYAFANKELSQPYELKYALMLLDSADESLIQKGISILSALALQTTSPVYDQAAYRLGEYYWYNRQFDKARELFEKVTKVTRSNAAFADAGQYWIEQARAKLSLISAE